MYKIIFINQKVIKPYDFEDDDMFLSLAEFDSVLSGRLETEFLIGTFLFFIHFAVIVFKIPVY